MLGEVGFGLGMSGESGSFPDVPAGELQGEPREPAGRIEDRSSRHIGRGAVKLAVDSAGGIQGTRERKNKKRGQSAQRLFLNRLVRGKAKTDLGSETIGVLRELDQEVRIEVDTRGRAAAIYEQNEGSE